MSGSLSPSGSGVSLIPPLRSIDTFNAVDYGAALNGTTDDAAAITRAMAAASAAGGGVVIVPGIARCASGITVPNGVVLSGSVNLAGASPGPCTLIFDLSVATCVTVGSGTTGAAGLRGLFINRAAGTIPAGSRGVYVFGGQNPLVEYVVSQRHDICFQFSANGLTGGISAHVDHLYSGVAQDAHLVIDGWPEFYCSNSRFGSNGAADLTCNAYVRVTGGVVGGGPNTINFGQCQFNQGTNTAAAMLEFKSFTATGGVVAQEFGFTGCHAEQCLTGIKSDAGSANITRLTLSQLFWNTTNPFLSLNAATQIINWTINNCQFYGALTLAPTAQINFLMMTSNYFLGAVSITSPAASNSVAALIGNVYSAGVTLTGPWASLISHDVIAGGSQTLTGISGAIDINPGAGNITRTYPATFNGVLIGGNGVSQQAAATALALAGGTTGAVSLGNANQAAALSVQGAASGVTQISISGGTTGVAPTITSQGETNTSMWLATTGTGNMRFAAGGVEQARVIPLASAVDFVTLQGAGALSGNTGGAVKIGAAGTDTDISVAIVPKGAGAVLAAVPDGTTVGGNARGANAVDLQTARSAVAHVASGAQSAVLGGQANTASGQRSVAAGDSNSATAYASTAFGSISNATGAFATAIGNNARAAGVNSAAFGKDTSDHSLYGAHVFGSGQIAAQGDAQSGTYILRGQSTGGAAKRLTADGTGTAGAANVCNLPDNTAWGLSNSTIIARDTTAGSTKSIVIRMYGCAVARGAGVGTVTLSSVNWDAVVTGGSTASISNFSLTADTTNGGLNLTFIPPDTNTWNVVAVFRAAEVQ